MDIRHIFQKKMLKEKEKYAIKHEYSKKYKMEIEMGESRNTIRQSKIVIPSINLSFWN